MYDPQNMAQNKRIKSYRRCELPEGNMNISLYGPISKRMKAHIRQNKNQKRDDDEDQNYQTMETQRIVMDTERLPNIDEKKDLLQIVVKPEEKKQLEEQFLESFKCMSNLEYSKDLRDELTQR